MTDIHDLAKIVVQFRDARDWEQFHNPKDLALSLTLEAAEVLEHFQWKNPKEVEKHIAEGKEELGDELADVLGYTLLLSHAAGIDIAEAFVRKMEKNEKKYPVEKSKGRHTKYTKL